MKEKGLKLKNSSKQKNFIGGLIIKGVLQIKQINAYEDQKLNQEITESVVKFIEKEIFKEGTIDSDTIDKKAIVKEILRQCYSLMEDEMSIIDNQLEYLIENNIVRKKGRMYRLYKLLRSILKLVS
jgi:hypothetical protein